MSWWGLPSCFEASCESPIVPPAPGTFFTSTLWPVSSPSSIACAITRAVESQPPPGSAGAIRVTFRLG
jgi:hypothetical protein